MKEPSGKAKCAIRTTTLFLNFIVKYAPKTGLPNNIIPNNVENAGNANDHLNINKDTMPNSPSTMPLRMA